MEADRFAGLNNSRGKLSKLSKQREEIWIYNSIFINERYSKPLLPLGYPQDNMHLNSTVKMLLKLEGVFSVFCEADIMLFQIS